jgi:ABC-type uncharacterized transport system fused permease/ATPase subunit
MKIAPFICSLCAAVCAIAAVHLISKNEADQRYYRAHNEVEKIAFGNGGSRELQEAVTHERAAQKDSYVIRDLGKKLVWAAAGLSTVAAILVAFPKRPKRA